MDFNIIKSLIKKHDYKPHIIFCEGSDKNIISAVKKLISEDLIEATLVVKTKKDVPNINCNVVIIEDYNCEIFINQLYDLRKHKNLTLDSAKLLIKEPNYFATMMLYNDLVDGYVGGITYSTADSIRPGLQIIKTKPGTNYISSTMIMSKDNIDLFFSDIAVNIDPNAIQLADFTNQLAELISSFNYSPSIALLSFSTKGSAKHPNVQKVIDAGKILDQQRLSYQYDYELQFDAAFDLNIRNKKAPMSSLKSNVNGFIFPDIQSANIGYKIAQRLGNYEAVGPIITGFNKVINDLSRGASVDEIYKLSIISALQVLKNKK